MKTKALYTFLLSGIILLSFFVFGKSVPAKILSVSISKPDAFVLDTPNTDDSLHYPIPKTTNDPTQQQSSPLFLNNPSNQTYTVEYDPVTNQYVFKSKIGNLENGSPYYMSLDEYMKYDLQKSVEDYWDSRSNANSKSATNSSIIPSINIGKIGKTLFGSSTIDIRPQGSAELIFGVISSKREDPMLNKDQQRVTNFDFQEKIQMSVKAKVGDKIDFGINYNTESSFEFDNKMKLAYEGDEDEIIQQIEAGDVSFPLTGTLITGSQTLFGVKTKLKFGKVTVSSVFSQQKSESKNITVSGGAQTSEFSVTADNYEENKHFFLSQYFRDHYNEALASLPAINSSINITKIEVWVTTVGAPVEQNRNIIAFQDLGEYNPYRNDVINPTGNPVYAAYPDNRSNNLKSGLNMNFVRNINTVSNYLTGGSLSLVSGQDFEKVESARKLNSTEYSVNSKLGFISLNTRLNSDQVLAVAYQYTVIGQDSVFKVGEFSDEGIVVPNNLVVKLLKSTSLNTKIPIWNLMMKNIYSIGAYSVNSQDFRLNIVYQNPEFGVPTGFITEGDISGQPLIRALGLDKLNLQLDPYQDGVFDFIDGAATNGGTIQSTNGRIYFPVVEPFGKDLRKAIDPDNPESPLAYKYSYDSLYLQTKQQARQFPDKNRFILEGRYKSSGGSEISLNAMQVPQGSVKVTAGGVPLKENVQYTVDYTLGRVKIIDEGILNSGTPITISLENNSMFSVQYKTLLGTHVDYDVSKDFRLGATIMNLTERPITPKVQTGDEPISNTIWGLDGNYQSSSLFLTKMVDKLPFIETKAPSKVNISGEFAHFIPGHPRALGSKGISYIDDFEGSSNNTDLKQIQQWFLASVPRGQTNAGMFPEMSNTSNDISVGYNRARLSWFYIDQMFTRNETITPDYIKNDKDFQSNHYSREIYQKEVFPNIEEKNNIPTSLTVLNLGYYPSIRGQYNYDVEPTGISKGIDQNGLLNDPKSRWAGIMRQFDYTDWDGLNYEYIEFWIMDPFIDPDGSGPMQGLQNGGDLYFNIGDISEDILKDGRKSFENGLPTSSNISDVDTTIWGRVPRTQALTPFFDNNPSSRVFQDVGYDGLSDDDEQTFRIDYLNRISNLYGNTSAAYLSAYSDPSADNFHHFEGDDFDNSKLPIYERYKLYNGVDGNSPVNSGNDTYYVQNPNVEDINKDYTLSEEERYYQYRVQLRPDKMNVGENYISDVYTAKVTLANKTTADVKWYLFRIPISNPELTVGQINGFNSIRFMRLFLKNFEEEAHLRLATLDLVKNEWRKYSNELLEPGEFVPIDEGNLTSFEVSKVNIEENGKRVPIPYVLPPGLDREIDYSSNSLAHLNEQSLVLKVCNLLDGDARAAYKTTDFDFRRYKKLKLYTHAEESYTSKPLKSGDLKVFIRLGTDFTDNYYEYEMPLVVTPWGASADDVVWPDANTMVVELDKLLSAKTARNTAIRESTNGEVSMVTPYSVSDGKNKITVKGTPTLSAVKTIMIGIRNPKKNGSASNDDGESKCGEIWVNELRVTDFDESSGAAANLVIAADLADFGNLTLAGNYSSNGFGSIEQTISERQQERILGYDVATNLELGKFFSEESGLRIPMHFDYSETYKRPEFSPLNPDIKFNDDLDSYKTSAERDSIRKITEDYTRRTSFNLMNVKKVRTGATEKPKVYDIENFDVSYSYSSLFHRDIDIEYDDKRQYKGALGYNFATVPKNIRPFDKIKFLKKYSSLALIRDFNFYYLPKQIGFRTDVDRMYNESLVRKKTKSLIIIDPTFVKTFSWNRNYDLRYDLSSALKIDYHSIAQARIGEPAGKVDRNDQNWDYVRDSIWNSVMDMGRITNFNQEINVNYVVPINKIPLLSWITVNSSYKVSYLYTAAPLSTQAEYGNTIQNDNTVNLSGSANFTNLYNKVPYFKKLNQEMNQKSQQAGIRLRIPTNDELKKDSTKQTKSIARKIVDNSLMILMSVKNASLSLNESEGSTLPGFIHEPGVFGMDLNSNAPGWDFILGSQVNIAQRAAQNDWLTKSSSVNTAFARKSTNTISGRVGAEPLKGFKIDIEFSRTINSTKQEYWRYDTITSDYRAYSPTTAGAFSISILSIKTSFVKDDSKTNTNSTFTQMKNNLLIIANRLAEANKNWTSNQIWISDSVTGIKYPDGYTKTNKDVMLYAFMAAYTGQDAGTMPLTPFPKIPKPNWRVSYNGLTDIPFIARYFKTVSISHAYNSKLVMGGYTTNILYRQDQDGMDYIREELGNNYLPKYDFNTSSINESFSPLINIDMTLVNSFTAKFSVRSSRTLTLSFANFQMTEIKLTEFIIGTGYRFKDVVLRLNVAGANKTFKSDITLKADISIRNNKTVIRRIIENVDQVSAGARVISINLMGDYQLSQRVKFKLFYDQNITNPFVNSQYNNSNINAGISLVFSLAN